MTPLSARISESGAEDEDLARRVLARDPDAFGRLFDKYGAPILGYLTRMVGCRETAEDLLQETMIRVHGRIEDYRERGRFRAWIFRIATNQAITHLRRARLERSSREILSREVAVQVEPSAIRLLEGREEADRIERAILRLPDEMRSVLLLRVDRGLGMREIAEILRVPAGTVKSRLHYAIERLRADAGT